MNEYKYIEPTFVPPPTPERPFRCKKPMSTEIIDASGRIFHYDFVDGKTVFFPGPSVFIGDGIVHQIQHGKVSPAPEGISTPTLDDIRKTMESIQNSMPPDMKRDWEQHEAFRKEWGHLFGKTKEELEQIMEHGAYSINLNGWYVVTGKGGFINFLLEYQNQNPTLP